MIVNSWGHQHQPLQQLQSFLESSNTPPNTVAFIYFQLQDINIFHFHKSNLVYYFPIAISLVINSAIFLITDVERTALFPLYLHIICYLPVGGSHSRICDSLTGGNHASTVFMIAFRSHRCRSFSPGDQSAFKLISFSSIIFVRQCKCLWPNSFQTCYTSVFPGNLLCQVCYDRQSVCLISLPFPYSIVVFSPSDSEWQNKVALFWCLTQYCLPQGLANEWVIHIWSKRFLVMYVCEWVKYGYS